jgi:translation initiation factor IF-2
VPVSAISGFGVNDLLEMILLVAEMKELKANKDRPAIATVIESHLDLKL